MPPPSPRGSSAPHGGPPQPFQTAAAFSNHRSLFKEDHRRFPREERHLNVRAWPQPGNFWLHRRPRNGGKALSPEPRHTPSATTMGGLSHLSAYAFGEYGHFHGPSYHPTPEPSVYGPPGLWPNYYSLVHSCICAYYHGYPRPPHDPGHFGQAPGPSPPNSVFRADMTNHKQRDDVCNKIIRTMGGSTKSSESPLFEGPSVAPTSDTLHLRWVSSIASSRLAELKGAEVLTCPRIDIRL